MAVGVGAGAGAGASAGVGGCGLVDSRQVTTVGGI